MNIFRIDGKNFDAYSVDYYINKDFLFIGNCVTGIGSDQVCGLDSMSTGCSPTDNLATVDCLCNPGVNTSHSCQSE